MIRDSDKGRADRNGGTLFGARPADGAISVLWRPSVPLPEGRASGQPYSRTRKEAHRLRWASSLIVVRSSRYERRARAAIATPPRPIAVATSSTSSIGMLLPLDEPSKLPVVGGRGVTAGVVGAAVVVAGG